MIVIKRINNEQLIELLESNTGRELLLTNISRVDNYSEDIGISDYKMSVINECNTVELHNVSGLKYEINQMNLITSVHVVEVTRSNKILVYIEWNDRTIDITIR